MKYKMNKSHLHLYLHLQSLGILPSEEQIESIVDTINKFRCGAIEDQVEGSQGTQKNKSSVSEKLVIPEQVVAIVKEIRMPIRNTKLL